MIFLCLVVILQNREIDEVNTTKGVEMRRIISFIILLWVVAGGIYAYAGEVSISNIRAKEPLARLLEISGVGTLIRGAENYSITESGIGFKKGDIFKVGTDPSDYVVIALNKSYSSVVKLSFGSEIVFLDDDGNFAVTGVYIASQILYPAEALFDINHASPTNEFLVWTPDAVVGVRGTSFIVWPFKPDIVSAETSIVGLKSIGAVPNWWNTTDITSSTLWSVYSATTWVWNPSDIWVKGFDLNKIKAVFSSYTNINENNVKEIYDYWKSHPGFDPFVDPTTAFSLGGNSTSGVMLSSADKKIYIIDPYVKLSVYVVDIGASTPIPILADSYTNASFDSLRLLKLYSLEKNASVSVGSAKVGKQMHNFYHSH